MADTALTAAARALRTQIEFTHAARVSEELGCPVTILRREPVKRGGKFTGINELVYGMPAEFVHAAETLGLLAEAR